MWSDEDIDKHSEPAEHTEKAPPHAHHVTFPEATVKRSSLKQTRYKSRIRLVSHCSLTTRLLEDYGEINPNV